MSIPRPPSRRRARWLARSHTRTSLEHRSHKLNRRQSLLTNQFVILSTRAKESANLVTELWCRQQSHGVNMRFLSMRLISMCFPTERLRNERASQTSHPTCDSVLDLWRRYLCYSAARHFHCTNGPTSNFPPWNSIFPAGCGATERQICSLFSLAAAFQTRGRARAHIFSTH